MTSLSPLPFTAVKPAPLSGDFNFGKWRSKEEVAYRLMLYRKFREAARIPAGRRDIQEFPAIAEFFRVLKARDDIESYPLLQVGVRKKCLRVSLLCCWTDFGRGMYNILQVKHEKHTHTRDRRLYYLGRLAAQERSKTSTLHRRLTVVLCSYPLCEITSNCEPTGGMYAAFGIK